MILAVSSESSKKRRHDDDVDDDDGARRKAKKARRHEEKRARREAKQSHEFAQVEASLLVALPPVFVENPTQGVEEMLDSMLMRYIPPLRGVVLAHKNMCFLEDTAEILGDSPFARCRVSFSATVWSPRIGQRLYGHITVSSPDHVAILVHRTFNAAITAAHLPRDEWEFVPWSADAESGDLEMADALEEVAPENAEQKDVAEHGVTAHARCGHWVHISTRERLGGANRTLRFTVIGLTIANQMLSVVGSLLPDPFAPIRVPPAQDVQETEHVPAAPQDAADAENELDFDIFAALGRSTDERTQRRDKKRKKDKSSANDESIKIKKRKKDRKRKPKVEREP